MSLSARTYLKKAIQVYRKKEGATNLGSYRDAVTDFLHAAIDDPQVRKDHDQRAGSIQDWSHFIEDQIIYEGKSMFYGERNLKERKLILKYPIKDLPLHINDDFEFEEHKHFLLERLKNASK